jgi:hypothetical protein
MAGGSNRNSMNESLNNFLLIFNGTTISSTNKTSYWKSRYGNDNLMNDTCLISMPTLNALVVTGGSLRVGLANLQSLSNLY